MKLSEQLKLKRSEKVARQQAILDARNTDGVMRAATTEEETEYSRLDSEVDALDKEIERAEKVEARSIGTLQIIKPASKRYNIGKAVSEFARGNAAGLTGLEAEQHQELSRGISSSGLLVPFDDRTPAMRASDSTTNAGSIDSTVYPGLSIIGQEPLWSKMGLTVLPGLHGQLELGKKAPDTAGEYAEKDDITATSNKATFVTLSPSRIGATDLFPRELLAQENPAVHMAYLGDLMKGVDRKITAKAYTIALAAATEVAAGDLTKAGFDALMAAVDADGSFAMSRASFFEAKGVDATTGGFGRYLVELTGENGVGRTYDGVKAVFSTLFADGANKQYAIYGAWEELWIGFWGAIEILINPYTYQQSSQTQITVNKITNIVCRNSSAFVKTPDLNPLT